MNELDA